MGAAVVGWVTRILLWMVILAACLVLIVAILLPRVAGATPYTILTGSMRPQLPPGTMAVIKPVDPRQIGVGDVITYQLHSGQPEVVTHRVVAQGIQHDGELIFRTKGDSNNVPDQAWVRAVQVRGRLWYAVPWLGYPAELISGREHQLLVYLVAAGLLGYAAYMFGSALKERRNKQAPA